MKALTAPRFAGSNVYRALKVPAFNGQLRLKSWRYHVAPSGPADPMWTERAANHWRLQAETFGIKFYDDMMILVDFHAGVVTTAIHVDELLPGKREVDYRVPWIDAARAEA